MDLYPPPHQACLPYLYFPLCPMVLRSPHMSEPHSKKKKKKKKKNSLGLFNRFLQHAPYPSLTHPRPPLLPLHHHRLPSFHTHPAHHLLSCFFFTPFICYLQLPPRMCHALPTAAHHLACLHHPMFLCYSPHTVHTLFWFACLPACPLLPPGLGPAHHCMVCWTARKVRTNAATR